MSDREELHRRLRDFLIAEVNRRDERQCVRIEVFYAPKGSRPTRLKDWERREAPEIFESLTLVEKLCTTIIDVTEAYADSFPSGKHRFAVITRQHLGGDAEFAFVMSPSAIAQADDSTALATPGAAAPIANDVLTQNNLALMRTNQMMFEGTIRTLSATNADLRDENNELRARCRELEKLYDEATSQRMEREFAINVQAQKHAQRSEALGKFLHFATIAFGQYINGGKPANAEQGEMLGLVAQLKASLRNEQIQVIFGALDQDQQAILIKILSLATRATAAAPSSDSGGQADGTAAA